MYVGAYKRYITLHTYTISLSKETPGKFWKFHEPNPALFDVKNVLKTANI